MGFFDELIHPKRASDVVNVQRDNVASGEGSLVGQGFTLDIYSLTANDSIQFAAFLDGFSDAYNSNWNAEDVYGRMDPIAVFSGTRRAISVSWKVPAPNIKMARKNLFQINKLISFLYPQYAERGQSECGATTINMGPLMRIKFGNLIQDARNGGGLLGYVNGITFDPVLEDGMFALPNNFKKVPDMKNTVSPTGTAQYYPKTVRLNMEFTVLHEHALGYRQDNSPRAPDASRWPYTIQFSERDRPSQRAQSPAGVAGVDGFTSRNGTVLRTDAVQTAAQQKVLSADDKQALIAAGAAGQQKQKLLAKQRAGEALRKSRIAAQVARNTTGEP